MKLSSLKLQLATTSPHPNRLIIIGALSLVHTRKWRLYHVCGPLVLSPSRGWRRARRGWGRFHVPNGIRACPQRLPRPLLQRGSCVANGEAAVLAVPADGVLHVGRTWRLLLIRCPCSREGLHRTGYGDMEIERESRLGLGSDNKCIHVLRSCDVSVIPWSEEFFRVGGKLVNH